MKPFIMNNQQKTAPQLPNTANNYHSAKIIVGSFIQVKTNQPK